MSSMHMFEANLGTRNEVEAAAMVLDHARNHISSSPDATAGEICASIVLGNLSLLVFPEQETKVRRGGL